MDELVYRLGNRMKLDQLLRTKGEITALRLWLFFLTNKLGF